MGAVSPLYGATEAPTALAYLTDRQLGAALIVACLEAERTCSAPRRTELKRKAAAQ